MRRKRVLLAHAGGTIGMRRGASGYEPAAGHLESLLADMPQLRSAQLPATESYEFEPLLDSADMSPRDWVAIAQLIERRYDEFDGFVVLHGTDTLAYTSSALSFLLDGLSKPVVVTGSQLPLEVLRSDATENLLGALLLAAADDLHEVVVCFGRAVMRGNRVTKVSSTGFDAFESPNEQLIAKLGVVIEAGPAPRRGPQAGPLRTARLNEVSVAALRLFPGIRAGLVENVLRPPLAGLVLETFGSGNAPSRDEELLRALSEASERGVVIVNTTQCLRGGVDMSGYATGSALARAGVVSGGDMTQEAALTKLIWLLGQGLGAQEARSLVRADLRGELTDAA